MYQSIKSHGIYTECLEKIGMLFYVIPYFGIDGTYKFFNILWKTI